MLYVIEWSEDIESGVRTQTATVGESELTIAMPHPDLYWECSVKFHGVHYYAGSAKRMERAREKCVVKLRSLEFEEHERQE